MRISDWSSDVCSSDLRAKCVADRRVERRAALEQVERLHPLAPVAVPDQRVETLHAVRAAGIGSDLRRQAEEARGAGDALPGLEMAMLAIRSEEHTSELQSLMRISYAVFCLKKKIKKSHSNHKY